MFYDASDHAFMRTLEESYEALRAEYESIAPEGFRPWPVAEAYTGDWSVFPLFTADDEWELADVCRKNGEVCPRTLAIVRAIPGVLLAGYSRLAHGTHVYPHLDEVVCPTVRCHLGLEVGDGAGLRMGQEIREHTRGRCLGFDSELLHESFNLSGADRVVLLVDVDKRHLGN